MLRHQIRTLFAARRPLAALLIFGAAAAPQLEAGDVQSAVYFEAASAEAGDQILLAGLRRGGAMSRWSLGRRRAADAAEPADEGVEVEPIDAAEPAPTRRGFFGFARPAKPTPKVVKPAAPADADSSVAAKPAAPKAAASVNDRIAELYARDGREMPDFDYKPAPVDTPVLKAARRKAGVKHPVLDATPEERAAMAERKRSSRQAAYRAKIAAARAEADKGFPLLDVPDAPLAELDAAELFPENPLPEIAPARVAAAPRPAREPAPESAVAESAGWQSPADPSGGWRPRRPAERAAETDRVAAATRASADPLAGLFADGDAEVAADERLTVDAAPAARPQAAMPMPAAAAEPQPRLNAQPDARSIVAARPEGGLKGFCPVSLCEHRELADADDRYSVVYRDRTYTFADGDALAKFRENPGKYAPVLGGLDAVRLHATGHEVEGVLDHAAWYAGRLYLFSSADTLAIFTASPKAYPVAD